MSSKVLAGGVSGSKEIMDFVTGEGPISITVRTSLFFFTGGGPSNRQGPSSKEIIDFVTGGRPSSKEITGFLTGAGSSSEEVMDFLTTAGPSKQIMSQPLSHETFLY